MEFDATITLSFAQYFRPSTIVFYYIPAIGLSMI